MTKQKFTRLEELETIVKQFDRNRLFLVVDPNAFAQSGAQQRLNDFLNDYQVRTFSDFEPNPKIQHVQDGVKQLGSDSEDVVIAIGGGTALDMAKLICCCAAYRKPLECSELEEIFSDSSKILARHHPLIAVPTTAGTGSEATQFAVVYINDVKHSVSHPSLLPDSVILDPTLTYSVPPGTTLATGLDAVTQAIESLWSVQSTVDSIDLAEQALRLGLAYLKKVVGAPTPEGRAGMMQAAHLAGQAINISRTTAPHALSYSMTIRHHVPHGMAVALSMGPLMRFNAKVDSDSLTDPRGMDFVRGIFNRIANAFQIDPDQEHAMDLVADRWEQMLRSLGCNTRLSEWGITEAADRSIIARSVNQQRLGNNPRKVTEQDLLDIVEKIA